MDMTHKEGYNIDNPGFFHSDSKRNGLSSGENCHASSLASTGTQRPLKHSRNACLCATLVIVTLLLVLSCVVIGLILAGIIPLDASKETSGYSTTSKCLSPACVKIAGRMLRSMDQRADPCQDFFQYACGGWVQENYIPSGKTDWTPLAEIKAEIDMFYRRQLGVGIGRDDPPAFQRFKELYEGCMDVPRRNHLGLEPVRPYIKMLGGMSYTSNWNQGHFDLTRMISILTKYQTHVLFEALVKPNGFNKSLNALLLVPPTVRWRPATRLKDADIYNAYKTMLTWYYQNITFSTDQVARVANFTTKVIQLIKPFGMQYSHTEAFMNKMSLAEMQGTYPAVNWTVFINSLFQNPVDGSFEFYVSNTTYFEDMNTLITETNSSVLNDFLVTAFMLDQLPFLWNETQHAIPSALTPYIKGTHEMCLQFSTMIMRAAGEAVFMNKFFKGTNKIKDRVKEVVFHVREAFLNNIREIDWIDQETKEWIIEKALLMGMAISHADVLLNLTAVEEMTPKSITKEHFFESVIAATLQYSKILYSTVNTFWEQYNWERITFISQPNAYNYMAENFFVILAGLIDEPFYSIGGPRYINYGSLGTVIGHEITHGFDSKGREYDAVGLFGTWWSNASVSIIDKKMQCFIDQFDNMTVYLPDENVTFPIKGRMTLSENVADAGGIRASFRAYQTLVMKNGPEPLLPGLPSNMTWQKLFFLATVQPFCQETTKKYLNFATKWDVHSPFMVRVRGWAMNSEDFASTFQCPSGTPMNPVNKCRLW